MSGVFEITEVIKQ